MVRHSGRMPKRFLRFAEPIPFSFRAPSVLYCDYRACQYKNGDHTMRRRKEYSVCALLFPRNPIAGCGSLFVKKLFSNEPDARQHFCNGESHQDAREEILHICSADRP